MTTRLTSIATRRVPGLPDVEVALQPMTALIGPRGSGKSRLLGAASWLLTGAPALGGEEPLLHVTAEITEPAGRRTIVRSHSSSPRPPLPSLVFLTVRDRLPALPDASAIHGSDGSSAEAMIEAIAERRMSGVSGEVLLIEEPELMLTPQQQRHFYGLLRRYAENNQVIYSTRAPALLDAVHYEEIVRLDLSASGMAVRRAQPGLLSDAQRVRLEAEFDHERTEMFFARAVVLVEGQTERLSLPIIFRRLGHDPDALGISIVEVGGKGNLTLIARVLAEMRIPHLLVFDSDRGRTGERENAEIRRSAGSAPVFVLDPDFESVAGIPTRDDKVLMAWQRFTGIDAQDIPAVFRDIAETAAELAHHGRMEPIRR